MTTDTQGNGATLSTKEWLVRIDEKLDRLSRQVQTHLEAPAHPGTVIRLEALEEHVGGLRSTVLKMVGALVFLAAVIPTVAAIIIHLAAR